MILYERTLEWSPFVYVCRKWRILSGNELGVLLGWFAWECWRVRHPAATRAEIESLHMIGSTVSTHMLAAMARVEGFHFEVNRQKKEIFLFYHIIKYLFMNLINYFII